MLREGQRMKNQFRVMGVDAANAASRATESLRKALIAARLAVVEAKGRRNRLEAEYIQAWNKAAEAAVKEKE
jgi:hypothetical protein